MNPAMMNRPTAEELRKFSADLKARHVAVQAKAAALENLAVALTAGLTPAPSLLAPWFAAMRDEAKLEAQAVQEQIANLERMLSSSGILLARQVV